MTYEEELAREKYPVRMLYDHELGFVDVSEEKRRAYQEGLEEARRR